MKVYRPSDSDEDLETVVVPAAFQPELLGLGHDQHGHQGQEGTYQVLARRCFWPNMRGAVDQHVKACVRCLTAKKPTQPVRQTPGHLEAAHPLDILAMDFL